MYIHELANWPNFKWNKERIGMLLPAVRLKQGRLLGRMAALGFPLQAEANLETVTQDIVKSSEIEGEILDKSQVRSSVARRLGIEAGAIATTDRNIEGLVELMFDATQKFALPLSVERLLGWYASLFPTGRSGMRKINVNGWRTDAKGPMQVVSGAVGREKIHYEAPAATKLSAEMDSFLSWFNSDGLTDPLIKAAQAHLWFVTIHPFDDGNGRIARAITDLLLARSENSERRFYSMSSQIRLERNAYYEILERTQKGNLDITSWLEWFLACLSSAFDGAEGTLDQVLRKAKFWERAARVSLNDRQRKLLNLMLDAFEGKLTSSKWAKIAKCSQDTAHRDIEQLIEYGLLVRNPEGGRSTSYSIAEARRIPSALF